MKRRSLLLITLPLAIAGCSDTGTSSGASQGAAAKPPAPVSVVIMKKQDEAITRVLPGRAVAFQTADVRPQVAGMVKQVVFREGSEVKAGDLLYKIDDASYAALVTEAQANLAKAQASVPSAEANFVRYERLVNSGATQIEYDNARVALLQARADVEQAKAALQSAQINLGYTEIKAPFDGVAGISRVDIGNLVTSNQTDAMTTLRQLDPIYIDLTESSTNLLELRSALAAGRLKGNPDQADIRLKLDDGTVYPKTGKLDMSEMAVSETTGTYQIRARFENPDNLILPGMYVRATVTLGRETGYLLPQRAATRNARGELSAKFVTADNKVETRMFEHSQASGNNWLVNTGITDGDKLIVDGFQWIADNAVVQPVETTVNEDGMVVGAARPVEAKSGEAKSGETTPGDAKANPTKQPAP